MAYTRQSLLSWGTEIIVYDCNNRQIGMFKEIVWSSFLKVTTEYNVFDENQKLIAKSEKLDFFTTTIDIQKSGRQEVKLYRGMWNLLGDVWQISASPESSIDPRVYLSMASYKTYVDNKRRSESSSDD